MGGQPMVMGPNGPLPAGMVLPYGGPPFSPTAGLPPRLAGGPPLQAGMRPGRVHRASDDLDKVRPGRAARLLVGSARSPPALKTYRCRLPTRPA